MRYSAVKNWLVEMNERGKAGSPSAAAARRRHRCGARRTGARRRPGSRRVPAGTSDPASARSANACGARPPPIDGPVGSGMAARYGRITSLIVTGPSGRMPRRASASGTKLRDRLAEALAQPFVGGEVEQPILLQRAAERRAELVAREVGLAGDVEVVARVERVVAMELEGAAAERVGAGLGQDVDLPAVVAAELRAVGVRFDAELADRRPSRAWCRRRCRPGRW